MHAQSLLKYAPKRSKRRPTFIAVGQVASYSVEPRTPTFPNPNVVWALEMTKNSTRLPHWKRLNSFLWDLTHIITCMSNILVRIKCEYQYDVLPYDGEDLSSRRSRSPYQGCWSRISLRGASGLKSIWERHLLRQKTNRKNKLQRGIISNFLVGTRQSQREWRKGEKFLSRGKGVVHIECARSLSPHHSAPTWRSGAAWCGLVTSAAATKRTKVNQGRYLYRKEGSEAWQH